MDITYSNSGELKINGKNTSITIDPVTDSKSDVVLLSRPNSEQSVGLTVFDGAGEYEVKGCMIDGIPLGPELTAFRVYLDDIQIGYMPEVDGDNEGSDTALSGSDVLFIPLKGLKAVAAAKIVGTLEPRIVVPISYNQEELAAFLSEMGAKDVEPIEKLKISRKDLPEDKQDIIVLRG